MNVSSSSSSLPPVHMLPQPLAGPPPHLQPMPEADRRLRWLSRGHHVFSRIVLVFGLVWLMPLVGLFMQAMRMPSTENWKSVASVGFIFLAIEGLSLFIYLCARRLDAGEKRRFCQAIAFVECLIAPLGAACAFLMVARFSPALALFPSLPILSGAVLGICSFWSLRQPQVRARFLS